MLSFIALASSLLTLAATALSLTACSDSEISFGAGVIVGTIIADDGPHHHHHRPSPPRYRPGEEGIILKLT